MTTHVKCKKFKPLKRVAQASETECGLACVAMVAKVPINRVRKEYATLGKSRTRFYTRHKDLEAILRRLRVRTARRPFPGWDELERHAIVAVNRRANGCFHWVVFDAGRNKPTVLDPKASKRRPVTDFRGLRASRDCICLV